MKKLTANRNPIIVRLSRLLVFALFIWIAYSVCARFLTWLSTLEYQVAAAVVAACATILISTLSLIFSKQYEHMRDVRQQHNQKKIPVYEDLIHFMFKTLFAKKMGEEPPTEQDMLKFLSDFTPKLIVWGSQSVIKSYASFKDFSSKGAPDPQIVYLFEDVMFAIRKDLEHKDTTLQKGDLLRLFITDIDSNK